MKSQTGTSKSANMKNATAKKLLSKNALQNDDLLNAKHTLEDIAAAQSQGTDAFNIEERLVEDSAYTSGERIVLAESEFEEPEAVVTDAPTPSTASTAPAPASVDAQATSATNVPANIPAGTTIIIQNAPAAAPVAAAAESGISMGWLLGGLGVVGGVAAAAGGGGGKADSTPATPPSSTVSGSVVAGPVIAGNQLKVFLYQADGVTLIGESFLNANGGFSISVGSYTGVVVAKVVDTGTGADYLDEATGLAKDLNANLTAVGVIGAAGTTLSLNITPLTTLAHSKLGAAPTTAQVTAVNSSVAAAFGVTDLHMPNIVPVNTTSYLASDGLSAGEKYGVVLAALSGMDSGNGGNSQTTIGQLSAQIAFNGTSATLSDVGKIALVSGASTAQSTQAGLQQALGTVIPAPTVVTAIAPTDLATLTPTQLSALTVAQIASLTPTQIAALSSAQLAAIAPAPSINAIATDNIISANEQGSVITGTAKIGTSVTITLGVGNTHTVTTDATGNWSYTLTAVDISALGQGTATVSAVASIGSAISASTPQTITIDTVVPATPGLTVTAGAANATAAEAAGAVTVSAELGSTVNVTLTNGVNSVVKTLTGTGAAQVVVLTTTDITTLGNGTISVSATATDVVGNASAVGTTNFILDTVVPTAPTIALTTDSGTPGDLISNNGALNVGAEAGASVQYSVDGGTTWGASFSAQQGANTVLVRQVDVAGNISATSSLSFTFDSLVPLAPTVALATDSGTPGDLITNSGTLNVGAEAGAAVQYSVDGGTTWGATFTAQQGANTVLVRQTDAAGNVSATSTPSFTFDSVAPNAPTLAVVASAANAAAATAGAVTVSAEAGSNVSVTFTCGANSVTKSLAATGGADAVALSAADLLRLGNGTVIVSATSTDAAGNISTGSNLTNFALDTVAPGAPSMNIVTGAANATAAEAAAGAVVVTASAPGDSMTVTFTNAQNIAVTKNLVGTSLPQAVALTAADLTTLGNGAISVTATTADAAGNITAATPVSFNLDTVVTAPVVTLTDTGVSATDGITSVGTLGVSGEAGATIEYSVDNGLTWSTSFNAVQGINAVQVRQTDLAGNISQVTSLSFTLDTIAPAVAPSVALTSDTGVSAIDKITKVGTLNVTGVATGATVEYSVDNGQTWTTSFAAAEGTNAVQVRQIDAAGNASPVTTLNFTLDTLAPLGPTSVTVGGDTQISNREVSTATAIALPLVAGESIINVSITGTHITTGQTLNVFATKNATTGNWEFDATQFANATTIPLDVVINTKDLAGNTSQQLATLTLDRTVVGTIAAPTVNLTTDSGIVGDNISNVGTLLVGSEAGATVEYSLDGGVTWSPISAFGAMEGVNAIQVRQTGLDGLVSQPTAFTFTLDRVAPATAPTVALANDTGTYTTDNITSSGALNVTGTEPGATLEYSTDGGTTWTATFTAREGANTVQVRQKDPAGNVSAASPALTFTLDTVAPGAPAVALTSDTGSSNADKITNIGTLNVTGLAAGTTVQYSVDNGATWTSGFSAVEGANNVQVRQIDAAGNASASTILSFTLDMIVPTGPVSVTSGGDTVIQALEKSTTTTLAIPVAADETVTSVSISDATGTVTKTATKNAAGNWEFDATVFADGVLTVTATTVDRAGNSIITTNTLTLNTTQQGTLATPSVALLVDSGTVGDGISNVGALNVIGFAAGATLEYSTDGGVTWTATFNAVEGANTVQVRQSAGGNTSSATTFTFTLDTAAPVAAPTVALATDSGVAGDSISNAGALSLSGVEAGATVEYSTNGGSTWSSSFAAQEGNNTVQVRQKDVAGNVSMASTFSFTLDTLVGAPTVALANDTGLPGDKLTSNGALTVTGIETGATVEYSKDGITWLTSPSTLVTQGDNVIQVRQIDAAGNISSATSIAFTLDSVAPAAAPTVALASDTGSSNMDGVTSSSPVVVGVVETGATVEYNVNNGGWSTVYAPVQGANSVQVRQIDAAGNASVASAALTFTLDTVAAAPTVALTADSGIAGDKITNVGSLTVTGTEAGATVEYSVDNGVTWSTTFAPVQGANSVQVRQIDAAGNISVASSALTFTLDTMVATPTVALATDTGSSNIDGITSNGALRITGLETGATVEYSVDGGANWSTTFAAAPGANTVQVRQTDVAGNLSAASNALTFTLDTVAAAPTVSLFTDTGSSNVDGITNSAALNVAGLEAGAVLEYSVNNGAWSSVYTPVQGVNAVQVRQVDAAGNVSAASTTLNFTYDIVAPTASVNAGGDGLISAAEVGFATSITVTPSVGGTVTFVQVDGVSNMTGLPVSVTATNVAGSNWTFDATGFMDGSLTVSTTTVDVAGNTAPGTYTLTKNTVQGVAQVTAGGDAYINVTENSTLAQLLVTAPAGDAINTVTVSDGVSTLSALWNAAAGVYEFDSTVMSEGSLTVTVNTTNAVGTADLAPVTLIKSTTPVVANVGGDAFVNAWETSAATLLDIIVSPNDPVVSITAAAGFAQPWFDNVANAWYMDTAQMITDGWFDLTITTQSGNVTVATLNKDTVVSAQPINITVGGDTIVSAAESLLSTVIDMPTMAGGETGSIVYMDVGGIMLNGSYGYAIATLQAGGTWTFDSTQFQDGPLTPWVLTTDAAGNYSWSTFSLTKSTAAPATANVGGDAYIAQWEDGAATSLNIIAAPNDPVTFVTIAGAINQPWQDVNGNWYVDTTQFADGTISLTISTVGNPAGTTVNLTKDTLVTVNPAIDAQVGVDAVITLNEIGANTAVNVTGVGLAMDETIGNLYIYGALKTGGWAGIYAAATATPGVFTFDATPFADGQITVQAQVVDAAGNSSWSAWGGNTLTLSSVPVDVGGDLYMNAAEAGAAAQLHVVAAAGDSVTANGVSVSGWDKATGTIWVTATAVLDPLSGNYVFDATQFADGSLTVNTVTANNPLGSATLITLDTAVPLGGPWGVYVGWNSIIDIAEASFNTYLQLDGMQDWSGMVASVTVTGTAKTGGPLTLNATFESLTGQWKFDATQFADGPVTVQTVTTDVAGNSVNNSYSLNLFTAPVNVGGDGYINQWETSTWNPTTGMYDPVTQLTVIAPPLQTVQSVTLTQGAVTTTASLVNGNFYFDASQFAETTPISVTVTTNIGALAPVSIIKDTVAPTGPISVHVGIDSLVTLGEISTATPLTINGLPAGEPVQSVYVYGYSNAGVYQGVSAINGSTGWTFDATLFAEGSYSVQVGTMDAAGNYSYNNYSLGISMIPVDVGGDLYMNAAEAGTVAQLHVVAAAGDSVTSVTVSGWDTTFMNWMTVTATPGVNGIYTFNSTQFADGSLTVNTATANNPAGIATVVTLDTAAPWGGPMGVYVGWDSIITAAEASTATALQLDAMQDPSGMVIAVAVSGVDHAGGPLTLNATFDAMSGSWMFDATQFADGPLTVQTVTRDVAGNSVNNSYSLMLDTGHMAPTVTLASDTGVSATDGVTNNPSLAISAAPAGAVTQFSTDGGTNWATYTSGSVGVTSSVEVSGDRDWFSMQLVAGTTYTIRLDGVTMSDPTLYLRDANGAQLGYNDDFNGLNSQITYTATTTGTYYLDAGGFSSNTGQYHLSITDSGAAPVVANAVNYATEIAATTATTGSMPFLNSSFVAQQGVNNVQFRNYDAATNITSNVASISFTLDSVAPAISSILVGTDTVVNAAENLANAPLTISGLNAGDVVNYVDVYGYDSLGTWVWSSAAQDVNGNWTFDATKFADGTMTVYTSVTDVAGNVANNSFTLSKAVGGTPVGGATVTTANGDMVVNSAEAGTATVLNVSPINAGDFIQSVVVSGTSQLGTPISVTAAAGAVPGTWTFDSTGFNSWSPVTVDVTVSNGGATAVSSSSLNMSAWSFWTDCTYNDLMLGQGLTGTAAAVHAKQIPGQNMTQVMVSGVDINGNPVVVAAQPGGTVGTWVFDSTVFADNSQLFLSGTMVDATTGNMITTQGGTLHLSSASTAIDQFPVPLVSVGAGAFINQWSQFNTTLNVISTGPTPVTSLTVTDGVNTQTLTVMSGFMATGFNPALFNEGVLTVTTNTGVVSHLYKDTVSPGFNYNFTVNGDAVINPAEIVAGMAPLSIAGLAAGDYAQSLQVYGLGTTGVLVAVNAVKDVAGNWTFDTAPFADGRLLVGINVVDAAGNWGYNGTIESQLILNKNGGFVVPAVNVGGDAAINAFELTSFNTANPAVPTPAATIDLAQFGFASMVAITGTSALTGQPLTLSTGAGVTVDPSGTKATFDATQFVDGSLSVSVNGGAASTLTLDTAAPVIVAGIGSTNLMTGQSQIIDLSTIFTDGGAPISAFLLPNNGWPVPFTCSQNGNLLTITADPVASGYGSIQVGTLDAAGNFNAVDFNVAVTANTGAVMQGGTTVVNAANTFFDGNAGPMGSVSNDIIDISGINTNSVIKGGLGADTVIFNTAVLDFAQVRGGGDASLDVLQLTANSSNLNLGMYNHFGQQALNNFEVINLAADAGANTVTLNAADLFLMGSMQTDFTNGVEMYTINGGTNDVVNLSGVGAMPVGGAGTVSALGGMVQTGVANGFNADGSVGTGYSKYAGACIDAGGNNYQIELLLQNGVTVM